MRLTSVRALALAFSLVGCASVPTLSGSPEDIADAIGGNAVAYNQAYGRAIADQVLLNVLRARDRQPLYHLSMSGITDASDIAVQRQFGIGSITLGGAGSPWGVGAVQEQRTTTTKPQYILNPFSSGGDAAHARQFSQAPPELFQHFWDNDWPREVLLFVMVDDITKNTDQRVENSGSSYNGLCRTEEERNREGNRCAFVRMIEEIAGDDVSEQRRLSQLERRGLPPGVTPSS